MDSPKPSFFLNYLYPPMHLRRRLPTNDELISADMRRDFARQEAGFADRTQVGPAPHSLFHQHPTLSGAASPPEQDTGAVIATRG